MATWPAGLSQCPLLDGYGEAPQSQVVRTQMDAGPAKQRRRFTAATRNIPVRYLMTSAELNLFEQWFDDDLAGGALPFTWPGSRLGTVKARIVSGDPPYQISPAASGERWYVSMTMEVLP